MPSTKVGRRDQLRCPHPDDQPANTCCVVRTGKRARVAQSRHEMTVHLDTIIHDCHVRLRKGAYEGQQARRRRCLQLGREVTISQRVQADHEASLELQMTRLSRLARAENALKGFSEISQPEPRSLSTLQLELAEMFFTTFDPPRENVGSLLGLRYASAQTCLESRAGGQSPRNAASRLDAR